MYQNKSDTDYYENFFHQNIVLYMNEIDAKEIAKKFLQQYFSIVAIYAVLKECEWVVTAKVGFLPDQVKKVVIDDDTGKIKSCY